MAKTPEQIVKDTPFIVEVMSMAEDYGLVDLRVKDGEKHVQFGEAMNGTRLTFPFIPDWLVWLVVIFSLVYTALAYKLI